jgi:hypothetical protein
MRSLSPGTWVWGYSDAIQAADCRFGPSACAGWAATEANLLGRLSKGSKGARVAAIGVANY